MKRFARELSGSGARAQTALRLAQDLGGNSEDWKRRIDRILDGTEQPGPDLVTHLDKVWSSHQAESSEEGPQGFLF